MPSVDRKTRKARSRVRDGAQDGVETRLGEAARSVPFWKRPALWTGAICLLALILRLAGLNKSYWYDETLTHYRVSGTLGDAFFSSYYPLAYVLTWFTRGLADAPWALRLPNLAAGVLAVLLTYQAGKAWHSRAAGLWAALLMALSAFQIAVSQDARYYGLLSAAGAAILIPVAGFLETRKYRDLAAIVLLGAAGALIHPFFALYLAPLTGCAGLFLLTRRSLSRGARLRQTALLGLAALATLLPITALYLHQKRLAPKTSLLANEQAAHSLTVRQFLGFLAEMLEMPLVPALALIAVLMAAAGWAAWRSGRRRPLILAAATLIVPLPLFLVQVSHWYAPRYFVIHLPWLLILFGIALVELARTARGAGGQPGEGKSRPIRWGAGAAALAVGGLLAVTSLRGVQRHYAELRKSESMEYRWDELVRNMTPYLRPQDTIVHLVGGGKARTWEAHSRRVLEFYLNRQIDWERFPYSPYSATHLQTDNWESVVREARQSPLSNIWVLRWPGIPGTAPEAARSLYSGSALELALLAEPTVNLVRDGGMEGEWLEQEVARKPNVHLATAPGQVFDGSRSLYFEQPEHGYATLGLSVRPDPPVIRNGEFEAWSDDGTPSGWSVTAEAAERKLARVPAEPRRGTHALEIGPAPQVQELEQRVAVRATRGGRIRFRARALAGRRGDAALGLRYLYRGTTMTAEAVHPGGGQWKDLMLAADIPGDLESDSVTLYVKRAPGGTDPVRFDSVTAETASPGSVLEPGRRYTLSFWARSENIRGEKFGATGFVVRLKGRGPDGLSYSREVAVLPNGTRNWRRYHYPVDTSLEPVLARLDRLWVEMGVYKGSGKVWVDNVQLEPKPHPTLFTSGIRRPHDEVFAEKTVDQQGQ